MCTCLHTHPPPFKHPPISLTRCSPPPCPPSPLVPSLSPSLPIHKQARFWAEVYDGAKLFYLSGIQHGRYLKREVRGGGEG
jgi:hypothetical protein